MTAVPVLARIRTIAIVALLSGATLLTAACGGSDGDSTDNSSPSGSEQSASGSGDSSDNSGEESSSSAPDACSLVTAADLQEAWGVEFNEGESSETTPPIVFKTCSFGQVSNEPPARTLTVSVLDNDGLDETMRDNGQTTQTLFEGIRDAASDPTPLEGIGDEAYRSGFQIELLSGDLYVTLAAPGASSPEAISGLEQLAEVVAGNL